MPAHRNGQPWTREDLERLRQLAAERKGVNAIADMLGRTPVGIKSKAISLGLKLAGPPKDVGHPASRDAKA